MKRFFGMMPTSEIKLTKYYKDDSGHNISIDSGEHGWTINYADRSTQYKDIDDTAENNLESALKVLKSNLNVTEVFKRKKIELI